MHRTQNYLTAAKNLKPLNSARLFASGLEITINEIGKEHPIVEIQLDGESVDSLKLVILDSIRRTLENRKLLLTSELLEISKYLEENAK